MTCNSDQPPVRSQPRRVHPSQGWARLGVPMKACGANVSFERSTCSNCLSRLSHRTRTERHGAGPFTACIAAKARLMSMTACAVASWCPLQRTSLPCQPESPISGHAVPPSKAATFSSEHTKALRPPLAPQLRIPWFSAVAALQVSFHLLTGRADGRMQNSCQCSRGSGVPPKHAATAVHIDCRWLPRPPPTLESLLPTALPGP